MTALVEDIYVNNRVIHQVLSDSRKVNQRGHIVEGELSGWPDTRQHQNLYTNVKLEDAWRERSPTWGVWTAPALRNKISSIDGETEVVKLTKG